MDGALRAVWADEGGAIIVGDYGVVLRYRLATDELTWLPYAGSDLYGVWGTSTTDFYVVGSGPAMYHYHGNKMTPVDLPSRRIELDAEILTAISGTTPDDIFAVGDFGSIYYFDGNRWSQYRSPSQSLRGVTADRDVVYFYGETDLFRLVRRLQ